MTSILVAICRISHNNYKRHYPKKKKDIFWIFYCISKISMKVRTFWKKKEYPGLIINEIIASERDVYF